MKKFKQKLLLLLLLAFSALSAAAHDFEVDGIYYLKNGQNATVTYKGSYYNSYNEYSGSVTIPSTVTYGGQTYTVTSIGDYAFRGCSGLTSINIPNSVTSIGKYAFQGCTALDVLNYNAVSCADFSSTAYYRPFYNLNISTINIGDEVERIPAYFAYGLTNLNTLTIGNSVTSIGNYAFEDCTALDVLNFNAVSCADFSSTASERPFYNLNISTINIGDEVERIPAYFAYGLTNLTSATIPNSVRSIGNYAFQGCTYLDELNFNAVSCDGFSSTASYRPFYNLNISEINIGDEVERIPAYFAYGFTNLKTLTIGNSVTYIDYSAFYGCSGLTDVTIPNSVTSIGNYAFYGCSGLTNVTIPNSVTSIGGSTFYGCSGLNSVTIPNSVTSIGNYAFYGCSGLTSVTIGNSVTSIGNYAFQGCTVLDVLNFNAVSCVDFNSYYVNEFPFYNLNISTINIGDDVERIPAYFAYRLTNLKTLTIGNSVTSIGNYAFNGCTALDVLNYNAVSCADFSSTARERPFYNLNISTINVGNEVERIPAYFAYGLTNLNTVTIGNSVTSIGESTFYGCSGLNSVMISDIASWCNISFSGYYSNPLYYAHHLYLNGIEVTDLTIPNSVTSIGNYAFYGCSGLTNVTIPNSVTSIGESTFYGCSGLNSVTIPNSVTSIGNYAFYGCSGLTSVMISDIASWCNISFSNYYSNPLSYAHHLYLNGIEVTDLTIPNSFTSIGNYAFNGCSGLNSVTIPNSVTSIGTSAFSECSGLNSVTIPNSVTSIGAYAFKGCSGLTDMTIPNSVTAIGNYVFYGCSGLNSVTIPYSVTTIGAYAFYGCSGLASVTIPNSVTTIGNYAFNGCSGLNSVTIGNSVTSIGNYAFQGCTALDVLNYNAVSCGDFSSTASERPFYNLNISTINIGDDVERIPAYFAYGLTSLNTLTIGISVTSIGNYAFQGCTALDVLNYNAVSYADFSSTASERPFYNLNISTINIGDEVERIPAYFAYGLTNLNNLTIGISVTSIGNYAFQGCTALDVLNFNAVSCADFSSTASSRPFYNLNISTINIGDEVERIPAYFAYGLTNLKTVTIGSSVTAIRGSAFYGCSGLTNVTIPNSVTSIGNYAFYGCSGLTNVTIPNSVTSIGESTFYGCSGLATVTIPNSVTSIGYSAFRGCSGLNSVTIGNSVTSIDYYAFYGCSGLNSVTIPNSVTSIGNYAFYGCSGLNSVTIGNSVTAIGGYAFQGCTALDVLNFNAVSCADFSSTASERPFYNLNISTINIGDEVERIPAYFAYGFTNLTNITIPNSVTTIGTSAFSGCSGLISVEIPSSVTTISDDVFSECSGLTSVSIPTSVASIGNSAFRNCSGLTSVTIPVSVTTIGNSAFMGSGLTSVEIPTSITTVSNHAFKNCTNLTSVKFPKTLKSIEAGAFAGCGQLTTAVLPNSLTTINDSAFCQCSSLKTVTIPNSVTTVGNSAFRNCTGLTSGTVTSSLTVIGQYAFDGCSSLASFTCMTYAPPGLSNSNSFSTYATTSLYVPRSGVSNYKNHTNWRKFAKIYEFVGQFTVPDMNMSKGNTIVVPVSMSNESSIIGFQTDIYLPEGFEFVKDGADYVVDPSERMARDHAIMCNVANDGALRVLCYSPTNKAFSGTSGELFYVTIKAPADAAGDYTLWFRNTILTTSNAEELLSPDACANLNVISYLPGDVNGNGEVSVIDIVTAAQYIIFLDPQPFYFEAADLNNDDQITVTDLALIGNLILYPNTKTPLRAPALDLSAEHMGGHDIQVADGDTCTVSIMLDNVLDYTGFQMDVTLPDGLTASNFQLTDRAGRHSQCASDVQDGLIRLLAYSPAVSSIEGHEGTLLTFDVIATGNVLGDILIDGIELVTTTCRAVHLDGFTIGVNNATSVDEWSDAKAVVSEEYYNIDGQRLERPETGVTIVVTTYSDGSRTTRKVIR